MHVIRFAAAHNEPIQMVEWSVYYEKWLIVMDS